MAHVKPGDRLYCNDPRYPRAVVVLKVTEPDQHGDQFAVYESETRTCYIRLNRIFDDGRVRAQGWRIEQQPPAVQRAGE